MTSDAPERSAQRRRGVGGLLATAVLLVVAGVAASTYLLRPWHSRAPQASPRGITAYFVFPSDSVAKNTATLLEMRTDAITFGYRVLPTVKANYPRSVQQAVGARRMFRYTGSGVWDPAALGPTDRVVRDGTDTWTVMDMKNGSVVVSRARGQLPSDPVRALSTAAAGVGAKVFVGLPSPRAGSADGIAWLPDTSYPSTMVEFTRRFVRDAKAEGAAGFYQSTEMPVTDTTVWDPVRTLYTRQNRVVDEVVPGSTVIVSPYLESRYGKSPFTPAQAARGARMLLATAQGTHLIIAPQDGLGVGTTSLAADPPGTHVAPLEQYLRAMRREIGSHLWTNIEVMQPAGRLTRNVTTVKRVAEQLAAETPYTSGTIAYIWDNGAQKIGARRVPGDIAVFSHGFGRTSD